MEHRCHE
jgi:hypothetical protein